MRPMPILVLSMFVSVPAFPSGTNVNHYDLDRTSCRAAAKLVNQRGAVVFQWGNDFYSRVVKNGAFCMSNEDAVPFGNVNASTRDCFPGYYCETRHSDSGGEGGP